MVVFFVGMLPWFRKSVQTTKECGDFLQYNLQFHFLDFTKIEKTVLTVLFIPHTSSRQAM